MDLFLHGRKLESVFELLGSKENSITYSVGWALANSSELLRAALAQLGLNGAEIEDVRLQEYGKDGGFTDIELLGPTSHVIMEAKRGWWLPNDLQWGRYAPRFEREKRRNQRFVAMSDCSAGYASLHLPKHFGGVPLAYLGWRDLARLSENVKGSNAEKRLSKELATYLRTVATMQNQNLNWVYVVSLGTWTPEGATITWIDIVEKNRVYFHPVGNRWPKEPPNYIAFRYHGQLQSIHHIEDYVVTFNLHEQVPEMPDNVEDEPRFMYRLGPPIRPLKVVKNGPRVHRSARVWTMIDLLLTSDTISEAMDISDARWSASGAKWPGT
jgi:hypothetical protein